MVLKFVIIFFSLILSPVDGFSTTLAGPGKGALPNGVIEGSIDDVAKAVATYFPKVLGKVIRIDGDFVEVSLGKREGFSKGTLLTVYREKEAFIHPLTGRVLGKFEEELGLIEVREFKEESLTTKIVKTSGAIREGDLVRITATRIRLAVSIYEGDEAFLMDELVSALVETRRFRVDSLPAQASENAARKRNNHYLIKLETSRTGKKFLMNLQIHNTESESLLTKMDILINQSEESDLILEHLQYQLFEQQRQEEPGEE
ncbi:MAG: hypothetical protein ABGX83_09665 [Nitrospira sp.]|nr:hypothetical protein [Candidatus Manganitrophaceae bacterium]HIL35013.1 hypothetical protein [Candidatus Manganitrophaceae bacterium]